MRILFFIIISSLTISSAFPQSFEWVRTGGGIGQDAGQKLAKDKDGNVYVTGYFAGGATFEGINYPGHAGFDIFVGKYQPDGTLSWLIYAGGYDNDAGTGIGLDDAGNIYVTGYFTGNASFGSSSSGNVQNLQSNGNTDIFIAKFEPSGKLSWVKGSGGFGEDRANDIAVDKNGNIYVTGYFSGGVSFGGKVVNSAGSNDVFTAKYDNAGNALWAESFGGFGLDKSVSMDIDTLGNVFITGFFYYTGSFSNSSLTIKANGLSADMFVIKYNTSGNLMLTKTMGGPYGDSAYGICVDKEGNFYVTGYFLEFAYFDTITIRGRGYDDIFLAKYDTNAVCVWAISEGGHSLDVGTAVDTDEEGNIYLTGIFDSIAWFSNKEYHSVFYYDIFVAKYSKKGILIWIKTGGGNDSDFGLDVLAGDNKTLYVTGLYKNTGIFGSNNTGVSKEADFYITKLSDNIVGLDNEIILESAPVTIYPNPTSGVVFISLKTPLDFASVQVFNIKGQGIPLAHKESELGLFSVNFEKEIDGIYFLRIINGEKIYTEKLLKYGER